MFYKDVTIGYSCRTDIVDIVIMSKIVHVSELCGRYGKALVLCTYIKPEGLHGTQYRVYSTEQ